MTSSYHRSQKAVRLVGECGRREVGTPGKQSGNAEVTISLPSSLHIHPMDMCMDEGFFVVIHI